MLIRAVGFSDKGTVRTRNEDYYCIGPYIEQNALTAVTLEHTSTSFHEYGLLVAVADGLGGYTGGGLASRLALETLSAQFYGERHAGCSIRELSAYVERCLEQTQRLLAGRLARSSTLVNAGTTLAGIVLMPPDYLVVFHAGDSRVLRASGGYIRALTIDHTPIARNLDAGLITEQEALASEYGHALTRALGIQGDTRVEVNIEYAWAEGDMFLIGTDGWHGLGKGLSRQWIQAIIRQEEETELLTRALITHAVAEDGKDNATVVIVDITREGSNRG